MRRAAPSVIVLLVSATVVAWIGWRWWPHGALAFAAEDAPLAWWQAALLVANAAAAGALATVQGALGARRAATTWGLLAVGLVLAALDERFMAHEALQDWLRFDLGLSVPLAQGVILVYALGGLALLHAVWTLGGRALQRWTIAALLAGAAAIGMDLAFDTIGPQIVEEWLEALAETLLLAGLFSELGSVASRPR